MRAVILALTIGLAVASYSGSNEVFRAGKEFVYELSSDVLTGIPHLSRQYSGMRIKCSVTNQISSGNRVTMKLDHIKLYSVADSLPEMFNPMEQVPDNDWNQESGEQLHQLADQLSKPCRFRYDQGVVSKIECDSEEPEWSINIKKGIVNLFQLNLGQQNQLDDIQPKIRDLIIKNKISGFNEQNKVYRVMEDGTLGECESIYQTIKSDDKDNTNVKKIVNYDNCKSQVRFEEGLLTSLTVRPHNDNNTKPLVRVLSHTDMTIHGDRRNFLIKEVTAHGEQILTPLSEGNGEIVTVTLQKMTLYDVRDVRDVIPLPRDSKISREGLKMVIPQKDSFQQERYHGLRDNEDRVSALKTILDDIVRSMTPTVQPQVAGKFRYLMYMLQQCTAQEIINVINQYEPQCHDGDYKSAPCKKVTMLYAMIPTVATDEVIDVYKKMIEDQKLTEFEISVRLNIFALHMKPTPDAIKKLLPSADIYNSVNRRDGKTLKRNLLLTLGSALHKYWRANEIHPQPRDVFTSVVKDAVRELTELYRSETHPEEQLAVLKCISNSGIPDFLPFLEEVLERTQQRTDERSIEQRIQTVYCLNRMPKTLNKKIQNMLLPICNDPSERVEVRQAAITQLMYKDPNYGTLQMIIHSLRTEPSDKYGSYVFYLLQSIIETSRPGLYKIREQLKTLEVEMKPYIPTTFMKNIYKFDPISHKYQLGLPFNFLLTTPNTNAVPNGFLNKLSAYVFGKEFSIFESFVRTNNLKDIINRLFGPHSLLTDPAVMEDISDILLEITRPIPETNLGRVQEKVDNIIRKLGLPKLSEVQSTLITSYVKVLSNEISFASITKEDLNKFIHDKTIPGIGSLEKLINNLQRGYDLDYVKGMVSPSSVTFPTLVGIPSNVNLTVTAVCNFRGTIRLTGNPLKLFTKQVEDFDLKVNVVPDTVVEIVGSMGVQLPMLRSGVSIKHTQRYPATWKYDLSYSSSQREFTNQLYWPQEEVVNVEHKPMIYRVRCQKAECTNPEVTEIECTNPKYVTPQTTTYRPMQGLEITYQNPRSVASWTPAALLKGKYQMVMKFKNAYQGQSVQLKVKMWNQGKQYNSQESRDEEYRRNYRSERRSYDVNSYEQKSSEDYQQVTPNPQITNPKYRQYMITFEGKGYQQPLMIECLFTQITSKDSRNYGVQWNAQVKENSYYNSMYKADVYLNLYEICYPEIEPQQDTTLVQVQFGYGKTSYEEKKIMATVKYNSEQTEFILVDEPYWMTVLKSYFGYTDEEVNNYYKSNEQKDLSWWSFGRREDKSSEDRERRQNDSKESRKDKYESKESRKDLIRDEKMQPSYRYNINVQTNGGDDFTKRVSKAVGMVCRAFVHYFDGATKQQKLETCTSGQQSEVSIDVKLVPDYERLYMTARFPTTDCKIYHYEVPYAIWFRDQDTLEYPQRPQQLLMGTKSKSSSVCKIEKDEEQNDKIETFDKVIYQLPEDLPTDCETVVAKDCSRSNIFTVLLKKEWQGKVITVLLPDTEIKVAPQSYSPKVIVNGDELNLRDHEKQEIVVDIEKKDLDSKEDWSRESNDDQEDAPKAIVVELKKMEKTVSIVSQELGLKVITDGKDVHIEALPFLSGHLCGLCGDYNGDSHREIPEWSQSSFKESSEQRRSSERSQDEELRKGEQMIKRYTIPSDQCQISGHYTSIKSSEECTPKLRNVMRRRTDDGVEQVCFSLEPIPVCSKSCQSQWSDNDYKGFHCLPARSMSTRRLMEESESRILTEMEDRFPDMYQQVTLDSECRPKF